MVEGEIYSIPSEAAAQADERTDLSVGGLYPEPWIPSEETKWNTSSRSSANHDCVEIGDDPAAPDIRFMRDSKDRDGPVLVFGRAALGAFLEDVRAGKFDLF